MTKKVSKCHSLAENPSCKRVRHDTSQKKKCHGSVTEVPCVCHIHMQKLCNENFGMLGLPCVVSHRQIKVVKSLP